MTEFMKFLNHFVQEYNKLPKSQSLIWDRNEIFWRKLSGNPNLPLKFVIENQHLPWDYDYITMNDRFTAEDILKNRNCGIPWNFKKLQNCKNLKFETVLENLELDGITWDWTDLACGAVFTIDDIKRLEEMNYFDEEHLPLKSFSWNRNLTESVLNYILDKNYHASFNWSALAQNTNLSIYFFKKHIPRLLEENLWLDFFHLSHNPKITQKNKLHNYDLPKWFGPEEKWYFPEIYEQEKTYYAMIETDKIELYNNKDMSALCQSGLLTLDVFVQNQHKDIKWNYDSLQKNPNLKYDFFVKYIPEKRINWMMIFSNYFYYDDYFDRTTYRKSQTALLMKKIKNDIVTLRKD